jgi:CBS domain containing-hemolysin-like protein
VSPIVLDLLRLLALAVFIGLNAYFVAAEFALITVRWTRIEELVARGKFGAKAVQVALEHVDDAIAACQLGITFASLALGWLGEPALAHLLRPLFSGVEQRWGDALSHGMALGIAYVLLTYMHVVLGEQAPKALAIRRAEDVALFVTGPLLAFARASRPFIRAIAASSNFFVNLLRLPEPPPEKEVHSVKELGMLVEETEEAGIMSQDQADYVRNVFRLSDKKVRDIQVPRDKVVTISLHASEEEVLETARETAHTRLPVWESNPDNIVGIVNTKDLFHLFSLRGLVIIMDAMYPAIFVDPDQPVSRLLRTFRRERRPMAIVRGADGKWLGIVTLEDILEEIVGEIEDEHDIATPGATKRPLAPLPPAARPPAPTPIQSPAPDGSHLPPRPSLPSRTKAP